jgi:hypothetical protein
MATPRLLAAALACAAAGAASARERPLPPANDDVRGLVAIRAAAAVPVGDARDQLRMDDLVAGAVPVGIELAARGGQTTLGFVVEYGRGLATRRCPSGAACSASVTRAGIELLHRFSAGSGGSGWAGAGLGWEGTKATLGGRSTRIDALELLNLQAGRDFAVGRGVLLGPFVLATFAQGMAQDGKDIKQKSPHAWFQLGLRAELGP